MSKRECCRCGKIKNESQFNLGSNTCMSCEEEIENNEGFASMDDEEKEDMEDFIENLNKD